MTTVIGPDISFYQDDNATSRQIDFQRMKNKDVEFVIIRAGQNIWIDPDFAYNWAHAKEVGLPRGSYWYYDSRRDPVEQANLYMIALNGDLGELPLFADLEEDFGGAYGLPMHWIRFIARLKLLANGHEVGIYTRATYLNEHSLTVEQLELLHQCPLWVAHYYNPPAPDMPLGWQSNEWLFHQYTDREDGFAYGAESTRIDMNRFNGDAAAFRARFNLSGDAPAEQSELHTQPFEGVEYHRVFRFGSWCHLVQIKPGAGKYLVTKFGLKKVSTTAHELGAQIVINGGDFDAVHAVGLHVSKGVYYSSQLEYEPSVNFSFAEKAQVNAYNERAGRDFNALAGKRFIVFDGKISPNTSAAWKEVHPRTLVGVGADGTAIWCVIDGRQSPYSAGVDLIAGANIMLECGAVRAIDLDGGGSSAMWIKDRIVNSPIDGGVPGQERLVGTHIAAFIDGTSTEPTGGTMTYTKGTVRAGAPNTNVKIMTSGAITAALKWDAALGLGDTVYGTRNTPAPNTTDLINITEIYRADGAIFPLPGPCKCVINNLILTDNVEKPGTVTPPPPTPEPETMVTNIVVSHKHDDGSQWVGEGSIILTKRA